MDGFQQTHASGTTPTTSYQDFTPQYPTPGPSQHPAPPGVPAKGFQAYYESQTQDAGDDNAAVNPQPASYPSQPPPPPPGEPPPGVGEAVEYVQGMNQQTYSEAAAGAVYWNGQDQTQWAAEYYKPEAQQAQYYQDMGQSYQDYYQYQYDGQYMGHEASQMGQFNPSQVQPPQQYYSHQVPGMDQGDDANMPNPASVHIDSTTDNHPAMAQIPVDLSQVIIPQAMAQQYIVPHQLQSGSKCLGMGPPMVMSKPKSTVPEWLKQEMMKKGIKPQADELPVSQRDGESEEAKQSRRFTESKSSAGLVKNEGKKDGFMASNSSAAAKEPSKHEDVTLNKVVKAIALPLLLSVTDSLFVEIAKQALAHPGEEMASMLAMEIITEVTNGFCAEVAAEVHQEANSAKVACSLESGFPGGKREGHSAAEEVAGLNLLGLGYASDSSLSNGGNPKVKGAMDRALMGPANHEGVASVAIDQDAPQQEDSELCQVNPDNPNRPSNISSTTQKLPMKSDEERRSLSEDASKEQAPEDARRKKKGKSYTSGRRAVAGPVEIEKPSPTFLRSKPRVGGDSERSKGGEEDQTPSRGAGEQRHGESSQRHGGTGGEAHIKDFKNLAGTKRTSPFRERSKKSHGSSPFKSRKHNSSKGSDVRASSEQYHSRARSGGKRSLPQQNEGSKRKSARNRGRDLSSGDDEVYRHSKHKPRRQDQRYRRAKSIDRHRSSR